MATEHTERVIVDRGGGMGLAGVLIGLAVLALVAIVGFYLISANNNDNLRTSAVTGAASSVSSAAQNVGQAAGDAVSPER